MWKINKIFTDDGPSRKIRPNDEEFLGIKFFEINKFKFIYRKRAF